jgi:membrane protease YdiL (CAAX protease family)
MPDPLSPSRRRALAVALVVAMTLPTVVTWLYFLVLATGKNSQNPAQQLVFGTGKVVQFLLPILVAWWLEGRFPRPRRPSFNGLLTGIGFGLLVAAAILGLYFTWLIDSPVLASAPQRAQEKATQMGFNSPTRYFILAAGYTLFHSLFEEYYYRWFVFGHLRKLVPFLPALILSSFAFMAHHVILLYVFLPDHFFVAAVPLSLCIATGGACWAYLYERSGSIYSAWVSHGIVDAAIFGLGWILMQRAAA